MLSLLCSEWSLLARRCNATNEIILIGHETSRFNLPDPAPPHLGVFSPREDSEVCIWVGISTLIAILGYLCISNTHSTVDPRILPLPRGFGRDPSFEKEAQRVWFPVSAANRSVRNWRRLNLSNDETRVRVLLFFSNLRTASCQILTSWRRVHQIEVCFLNGG